MTEYEKWAMSDVECLFEDSNIYDGWSAALLKDGRIVNRWPEADYPRRHQITEDYIKRIKEEWND